ncbi:hypothetical protein MJO29_013005 [Puccinia striiformis f. sp. tritici]|nr:hypothetical protein MJO29_013005 [Puccinia striiformis f. sp. tritici]
MDSKPTPTLPDVDPSNKPPGLIIGLQLQHLLKPTTINLAMENGATAPIILKYFVGATMVDPTSCHTFTGTALKIGPLKGPYALLLGTPFLSRFCLGVSIASRSLNCESTGLKILHHRLLDARPTSVATVTTSAPAPYPCESSESSILDEFKDLFPIDIPAVSDAAEEAGLFRDAAFPEKMQSKDSRVRHRIILTDPQASFNKRQYPYPRKHLAAWRVLLDQHIAAGQIRRSSSQYASPSMIIPKKDPMALPRWVCDYRTLNSLTVKDRSPLPNVDELIPIVASGKFFSILDQTNTFFQTRMQEADIPLTAVKTPWGLMVKWCVMPMGLTNAPGPSRGSAQQPHQYHLCCLLGRHRYLLFYLPGTRNSRSISTKSAANGQSLLQPKENSVIPPKNQVLGPLDIRGWH